MAHDPITATTTPVADNREPRFVHPEQERQVAEKLAALEQRTGRKPNVLFVYMDDVGWGDFGCYGGGVMAGPSLYDRVRRRFAELAGGYALDRWSSDPARFICPPGLQNPSAGLVGAIELAAHAAAATAAG